MKTSPSTVTSVRLSNALFPQFRWLMQRHGRVWLERIVAREFAKEVKKGVK